MPALPTLNGWTIDYRLRELRRFDPKKGMIFISFDSKQGKRLLSGR